MIITVSITVMVEFLYHGYQLLFFQSLSQFLRYFLQVIKRNLSLPLLIKEAEGLQSFFDWVPLRVFSLHYVAVVPISDSSTFLNVIQLGQFNNFRFLNVKAKCSKDDFELMISNLKSLMGIKEIEGLFDFQLLFFV